ncbi:unnamed protein product [Sphenostylis stenocarpa]|uniref:Uncharacterized protein n=1 Tax=Sphenostylis stenocarpa TaxID=92480 RepID=A0AA86V743_9FABA|nr:unnamed protein product [Sphenostylis stenocarpa]
MSSVSQIEWEKVIVAKGLEFLVDDDVVRDLEQMEKESDLDDILNYRSAAEYEMQEFLSRCSTPHNGKNTDIPTEKSCNDEHPVKSRGWLNWLSRGMLGAGGTDDSSQFSGVVSYDVKWFCCSLSRCSCKLSSHVQVTIARASCHGSHRTHKSLWKLLLLTGWGSDLGFHDMGLEILGFFCCVWIRDYKDFMDMSEATEFHPLVSSSFDSAVKHELYIFSMKFEFDEISATLFVSLAVRTQSRVRPVLENHLLDNLDNSCSIQVNFTSQRDTDMSVQGIFQQLEVTVDANILSNLLEFYDVFTSFKFHNERGLNILDSMSQQLHNCTFLVLLSLNGIENDNIRLLSKAE